MMDHYEELGLEHTATTEEIRRAYKRLVRLLHPDRCKDAEVRRLAELQMKRLNAVMSVLTNRAGRADYDQSLIRAVASPLPTRWAWRGVTWEAPEWFWPAAAGAAILFLAVLLFRTPQLAPLQQAESPAQAIPVGTIAPVREERPRRARSTRMDVTSPHTPTTQRTEKSNAVQPAAVWQPDTALVARREPSVPAAQPVVPAIPQVEFPAAAMRPTLSGDWLFVPSSQSKGSGLYPPEYIELRVTEEAGILHGRYRARYRIADRAISPTVTFQFEGKPEGGSIPWNGIGGAKGEVSLRLLESGSLEVNWIATQMGDELGLISGTARLVRRLD